MKEARKKLSALLFISLLALAVCPGTGHADDESSETGDKANSWRFNNGELVTTDQGAYPDDDGIQFFSAEKNDQGYTVFNWFDRFNNGYCSGDGAKRVIDVSVHNGNINWAQVKAAGIDYAIIRCGYGQDQRNQDDGQWLNNVKGCQENGIPFGVYLYSYAYNTNRAAGEGQHVLTCLKQAGLSSKDVSLPIYYDLEEDSLRDKDQAAFAKAFFAPLEKEGYKTGTYASQSWWNDYLADSCFDQRAKWVAAYNASRGLTYSGFTNFKNTNGMWQFSDYGKVPGISTRCDLNYTYMSASSQSVAPKTGWINSGGKWWYRHADGSYTRNDWEKIDGYWYHFDASGWMQTGWLKLGRTWYYLSGSGAMQTGWQKLGGKWYYLDGSGAMQTGRLKLDGTRYYLDGSGAMQTGWFKAGGKWFYANGSGAMLTGWQCIGGSWYYMNANGTMQTGWQKLGGKWYYFSGSGAMLTGWYQVGSTWYYSNGSGAMLTGWQSIGGKWYYLNGSGAMETGWYKVGSNWYYSNPSGVMRYSTWIGDYYLLGDGRMATNRWVGGYYVGADGKWAR